MKKTDNRIQTIFRVVKDSENPYIMINKKPIERPDLSYKAKGIWTYLMGKPDDWRANIADLVNHATDGDKAVRSGVAELVSKGYMAKGIERDLDGRILQHIWFVFESPIDPANPPDMGVSIYLKPVSGETVPINPTKSLKTAYRLPASGKRYPTNNKETNNKGTNKKARDTEPRPNFLETDDYHKNRNLPEIQIFRNLTARTPGLAQMEIIYDTIRKHGFTEKFLAPYAKAWISRGYNIKNIAWLTEWAVAGQIPQHGKSYIPIPEGSETAGLDGDLFIKYYNLRKNTPPEEWERMLRNDPELARNVQLHLEGR